MKSDEVLYLNEIKRLRHELRIKDAELVNARREIALLREQSHARGSYILGRDPDDTTTKPTRRPGFRRNLVRIALKHGILVRKVKIS